MAYLGNFDIYRCDECGYEIHVKAKRDINNEGWFYQWWTDDKTCIDMLEYAYNHGASVESLKNIAKTAKDLASLKNEIWEAME